MKLFFKQMLKFSDFYLEKQKSFISKKKFVSRCQCQNKKALFTDPIFCEGFVSTYGRPSANNGVVGHATILGYSICITQFARL